MHKTGAARINTDQQHREECRSNGSAWLVERHLSLSKSIEIEASSRVSNTNDSTLWQVVSPRPYLLRANLSVGLKPIIIVYFLLVSKNFSAFDKTHKSTFDKKHIVCLQAGMTLWVKQCVAILLIVAVVQSSLIIMFAQ